LSDPAPRTETLSEPASESVTEPVPDPAPVLEIDNVFQHVAGRLVLDGVSLRMRRGEGLLLLGHNGAGKSLLMRLVLGLDTPSAGEVRLFGQRLPRLSRHAARALRGRMGAVLQRGSLLDGMTVLENLLLPLRAAHVSGADMARAARLAMTQFQLDGLENHLPRALSVGQRRRVELARALGPRPDLLVWDGLTDGLDMPAVAEILEVLRTQIELRGLTIIATDNSTFSSLRSEERVAVLDQGRILFDGSREALDAEAPRSLPLRYLLEGSL
jgi:ABC-type transporter Mla maintaining outer membrane lipid asymmetry ATPase subunit MlaF